MCGQIVIRRVKVRPGKSLKYRTLAGEKTGVWGLGEGKGAYNARVENLDKTWPEMKGNRAVLVVDGFDESGVRFKADAGETKLAAIYDASGEFVILTCPSANGVEKVHRRMPIVIEDEQAWLEEGKVTQHPGLVITQPSAAENRRNWLAKVIH